jgi:hypothetical protein
MTLQPNGDLVWVHAVANCVPQDVKKTYRLIWNILQWLTFGTIHVERNSTVLFCGSSYLKHRGTCNVRDCIWDGFLSPTSHSGGPGSILGEV